MQVQTPDSRNLSWVKKKKKRSPVTLPIDSVTCLRQRCVDRLPQAPGTRQTGQEKTDVMIKPTDLKLLVPRPSRVPAWLCLF